MTQTITAFNALAAQHQQANELAIQAAALHNDVEAQLIQQIGIALTARDDQALRDINAFMTDVMWDCGDDFAAEPTGVIQFMRHYDRDFCDHQLKQAERALRGD